MYTPSRKGYRSGQDDPYGSENESEIPPKNPPPSWPKPPPNPPPSSQPSSSGQKTGQSSMQITCNDWSDPFMDSAYHEPHPWTLMMQQAARVDAYLGNQYKACQKIHSRDQRESSQYANPSDSHLQSQSIGFQGTNDQRYNGGSQNGYSHNQYLQIQQPRHRPVSYTTSDAALRYMPYGTSIAGGSMYSTPSPTPTPTLGVGGQYQLMGPDQNAQTTAFDDIYGAEQWTQSWHQG